MLARTMAIQATNTVKPYQELGLGSLPYRLSLRLRED